MCEREIDPSLSFLFPSIVLISENIWSFLAVNSQLGREQKKHFDISFSGRVHYLHQFPSACSESLNSRSEKILFFPWRFLTHKCSSVTSSFYVWVKALADLSAICLWDILQEYLYHPERPLLQAELWQTVPLLWMQIRINFTALL